MFGSYRRNRKEVYGFLAAVVLLSGLVGVHIYVRLQEPSFSGPLLAVDHLFDVALVLALLAVCAGVGRFTLTRSGLSLSQPIETLVFSTAIGSAILATSILVFGLLGLIQAPLLLLLVVAHAALARKEIGELPSLTARAISCWREPTAGRSLLVFGTLGFGIVAVFLIILALAPPVDWDAQMYHLQVPVQFLQKGRIYLPEDNLHAAFVGLVHMLYLPLLALGSSSGPALLNAALALLLGAAVFAFCRRMLNDSTASLVLALLWGTTTILLVATTPRVDVTLALYLFLAHYALLIALLDSASVKHLYLAAALLGFALGIKYHAMAYVLGLSPLVLWVARSHTRHPREWPRPLFLFAFALFVAAAPWLIKNWILLGAPLYPLFTERLTEPWLALVYGNRALPSSVSPEIFAALSQVRTVFNLRDLFLEPGRLTVELEGRFYYANPILLLLPLWVLYLKDKTLNWLVLPAVGYLLLLLVTFPATNPRYLIPAAAPLTIAATHMAVRSCNRLLSVGAARPFLIFLAALAMFRTGSAMYDRISKTKALGYLGGMTSAPEYLATHPDPSVSAYAPLIRFVNEHVPEDSRILMLLDARGYYLKPSVIQDNVLTNWPFLAPKASTGDCLKALEISHVMVNWGSLRYYAFRGLDVELLQWGLFTQFAETCLAPVPVYEGPGINLYRVR